MILKNLLRRKGRTLLTILGISVGVAAMIGLGGLANGLEQGYGAMLSGSQADLVLSQPDSLDISYSAVDEAIGQELMEMPEAAAVSGMLEGFVQTEGAPYFFVFGYPEDSFVLDRFQIKSGEGLAASGGRTARGKTLLLGSAAAESLKKEVGETLRLGDSVFRVAGIYETGEAFEDNGAVVGLREAQELLGRPRQVSLFYIQLKSPDLEERLSRRAERVWPDLLVSGTDDFAQKQQVSDMLRGYVWAIAGLAILIGGISMMNAQLMSIVERTREIGVLRAVGWSRGRVLRLILGEALLVSLAGGLVGAGFGWLMLSGFASLPGYLGSVDTRLTPELLTQSLVVVLVLGVVGGGYPAWRASRLEPAEALRYEGGSGGQVRRLPAGGMAVQSLRQRTTRTLLTLGMIGLTVGSIMVLEAVIRGATASFGDVFESDAEIVVRQADIADTSLSALDERVGDRLAALPEVEAVSGMAMAAITLPETGGFFILQGYAPREFAIRRFNIVEGQSLTGNRQILLGRMMATSLNAAVGDTIELAGSRFRVTGIYESGAGWEEMGGVSTLRDAQVMAGRPRKVTLYMIKVRQAAQAGEIARRINDEFPEAHAALAGEFVDQMPDMQVADGILQAISILAILVGGMGVMNTMLMAVLERTREIGVLRALGWRRRMVLSLILQEALWLGGLGGLAGSGVALGLGVLIARAPVVGQALTPIWGWDIFVRALAVALVLGVVGGMYPAYRATRLQPVEALRYE